MSVRAAKTYHLHLHFFHGWGFDATYWNPFLKVFRAKMMSLQKQCPLRIDGITLNVHDEGYFGGERYALNVVPGGEDSSEGVDFGAKSISSQKALGIENATEDAFSSEGIENAKDNAFPREVSSSNENVSSVEVGLDGVFCEKQSNAGESDSESTPIPLNIVLAHSFGLHKWSDSDIKPDILCVSGGFLGFHDVGGPRSKRVVEKMITAFESDPGAVLSAFYGNVFHPQQSSLSIPVRMNVPKLLQDLRTLNSVSISPNNIKNSDNVLLLQGSLDLIVPREHAEILANEIPEAKVLLLDGEGHGIFFTNPVETCDFLLKCLESEYLST
jgi:hypothetical protein